MGSNGRVIFRRFVNAAGMVAGATMVKGLSYAIRNETAARQRAITAAVDEARARAQIAAVAARLTLGPVRAVVEQQSYAPMAEGMGGAGGEGIVPGEIAVRSRVAVTFGVA
jgi:uncharacterized protein YggE